MDFDHIKAFKIPLSFLKNLGMWQERSSSRFYRAYGAFIHVFFLELTTILHTVHLIDMIMSGTVNEFSDALNILFSMYSTLMKSYWFLWNFQTIKSTMKSLESLIKFSSFGKREQRFTLENHLRRMTRVSKIYFASAYTTISSSVIISLVNFEHRRLPYESWVYWDYKQIDVLFWLLWIHQLIMSFIFATLNISIDVIPIIFITFVLAIVEELLMEIESLSVEVHESNLTKLQLCIECHIKIKELSEEISRHLSFPFFLQAFMSAVILCTSAYLLTSVSIS